MIEMQQKVTEAYTAFAASGKLDEAIRNAVADTVKKLVTDNLGRYSDFGKSLETAIKDALRIDANGLGINGYNAIVLDIVRQQLKHQVHGVAVDAIRENMERLLQGEYPREITLTELAKRFKEYVRDYYIGADRERHDPITFIVDEPNYSSQWVRFDARPGQAKYSCRYMILVRDDGTVAAMNIAQLKAGESIMVGSISDFERHLFFLHATGGKITGLDADIPTDMEEDRDDDF